MITQTLPCKAELTILRAEHLGMCFGVRDAITLARQEVAARPLSVLGELVHNATVLDDLEQRGVKFENEPERVDTLAAMITAHGASDSARERVRVAGLAVSDATCPLVHFAHEQLRKLVAAGFHPVIIGRRGHVEVRGLTEDLAECDVILNESDIVRMETRASFGVVAQTTQPIARVRALVECLRENFPDAEVRFVDTVCHVYTPNCCAMMEKFSNKPGPAPSCIRCDGITTWSRIKSQNASMAPLGSCSKMWPMKLVYAFS